MLDNAATDTTTEGNRRPGERKASGRYARAVPRSVSESRKYFSSAELKVPVMRTRTDLLLAALDCSSNQPVDAGVTVPGEPPPVWSPLALSMLWNAPPSVRSRWNPAPV